MYTNNRHLVIALIITTLGILLTVSLIFKTTPNKKETIFVGVVSQDKPYSWYDHQKKLTGFNVDLVKKIARKNNMHAKFITGSHTYLYHKFKHGKIQLLLLNRSPAELAKKTYSKTDTYLYQPNVLLTLPNHRLNVLEKAANRKIAISDKLDIPSTLQDFKISFSRYSQTDTILQAVLAKHVSGAVISDYAYSAAVQNDPLLTTELVKNSPFPPLVSQQMYGVIPAGNKELLQKVNQSLTKFKQDGSLAELSQKYFSQDWSKQ
ncbi:substrate-binding periplasmic protein [Liquorilactobacillus sucicola]|uniref:substrate-binding periplasmic protein n=1 Tax=Liquorilactobacillus sucicola TaxID=519050 RepID=UPI000558FE00|nr:transporter substrate-binding domain-containing protein [Liquorilactobacillus sucicola]